MKDLHKPVNPPMGMPEMPMMGMPQPMMNMTMMPMDMMQMNMMKLTMPDLQKQMMMMMQQMDMMQMNMDRMDMPEIQKQMMGMKQQVEMMQQQMAMMTMTMPRLGMPAPQFEAQTTHGTIRLEDYKGNWLILFSHPADFTPVCTTELMAFAKMQPELRKMNVELLGLSIDSVYSHLAWMRNIEEKMATKIDFPVIADLDKKVATLYGMIMPGESKTETSRCVYIIDDKQILRAMIYYPLTTGRNMDEIMRVIQALQMTDAKGVATPANWKPGDKVIMPPPQTMEAMKERMATKGLEMSDWYFAKKPMEK